MSDGAAMLIRGDSHSSSASGKRGRASRSMAAAADLCGGNKGFHSADAVACAKSGASKAAEGSSVACHLGMNHGAPWAS